MEVLTRDELSELMEARPSPCVSIYMPTYRAGKETEQAPIRLKNALREVQEELIELGTRPTEAAAILEPAQQLLQDGRFWRYQADTLAVFLAPGFSRHHRLPLESEALTVVSERFHLKPLLPLLSDNRFYILALSQNAVRLIEGSRYGAVPVELDNVAHSLAELRYEWDERLNQWRAFPRDMGGRAGMSGSGVGAFPGHGILGDPDLHKKEIQQFFLQLDRGLQEVLRDEKAPMVLAAVEFLVPIYQEVNTYPHLLSDTLRGNPELLSPEQLHEKAFKIVEDEFHRGEEKAIELYKDLTNSGRIANHIHDILPAAAQGRVDCLFVASDVKMWGSYDPQSGDIEIFEGKRMGSQDLLDLAAYHTLANSGLVYARLSDGMPDASPVAAILRY